MRNDPQEPGTAVAASIQFAKDRSTGKIVHIQQAKQGKACNCICVACGESLIARKGDVRQHHFGHQAHSNCKGAQETALHQLGKEILIANDQINVPGHGKINYSKPLSEQPIGKFRSDVTAYSGGQPIHFEIAVTHPLSKEKAAFLKIEKHRCVEILLSLDSSSSIEEVTASVLDQTKNKKVIYWETTRRELTLDALIIRVLLAIGAYCFIDWVIKRIRR